MDQRKELFPTHLTPQDINLGIKSGQLMQGSFFLSHTNYREATIRTDAYEEPILIQGQSSLEAQGQTNPITSLCLGSTLSVYFP